MKAELTLPSELAEQIADKVIERLKPVLAGNGRHKAEDTIFDVKGLAEYLRVLDRWIYERTHLKEIPHYKIGGQLRFRKRDIDKWLELYKVPAVDTPEKVLRAIK